MNIYVYINIHAYSMWPWTTKPVLSRWGIFVAKAKNTLYGSKLLIFFYAKNHLDIKWRLCSMKIFSKFLTVNISKPNFWLMICIAKNFIWTALKAIFSIFWELFLWFFFFFFFAPSESRVVSRPNILSYHNKPYINGQLIYSFDLFIHLILIQYIHNNNASHMPFR